MTVVQKCGIQILVLGILGVSQLTHVLYDGFQFCYVGSCNEITETTKLGARFAQVFPCMCGLSEYNHISISDFIVCI